MKVINEIQIYELNGVELQGLAKEKDHIKVESHWNRSSFVVINYSGTKFTVLASELRKAIDNATNSNK